MASGESIEVKTEDVLTESRVRNSLLEGTNFLDTEDCDDILSSDLEEYEFVQKIGTDTKNSDKDIFLKTKVGKKKKKGNVVILKDGRLTFKSISSSLIIKATQFGIRKNVEGLVNYPERELLVNDFMAVQPLPIYTRESEPNSLEELNSSIFKTYAPYPFHHFRNVFGIKPEDFVSSFCDWPLVELPNPGASGSLFYLTHNGKLIIKTVQRKEATFLLELLPGYSNNLRDNSLTLLPKFLGFYCFQHNSKNVRMVVMNNVLSTSLKIHQKYDLKGSTYNRKASVKELQKNSPTFKDLDFLKDYSEGIFLETKVHRKLKESIERDCRILESFQIIDYSLLVGVHNLNQAKKEDIPSLVEEKKFNKEERMENLSSGDGGINVPPNVIDNDKIQEHQKSNYSIKLPTLVKPPNTTEKATEGNFTFTGFPGRKLNGESLLLYVGIIDILQSYRLKKRLEHLWKSVVHKGDEVSVHNPAFYSSRFQNFIFNNVFKTNFSTFFAEKQQK